MDEGGQPVPARSTLLSTYWRDPEWLAYFPLNANTVVDYFSRSTFFDPESTNEVLRMQNIANPNGHLPGMGKTAKQQQDELTRFTGIEFVLVLQKEATGVAGGQPGPSTTAAGGQEESLFIIQKRRRLSPVQTQVLDTYYVLNGNVHMAPDLETVLANRLTTALHSLRQGLSLAREARARPVMPLAPAKQDLKGKGAGTLGATAIQESTQKTDAETGEDTIAAVNDPNDGSSTPQPSVAAAASSSSTPQKRSYPIHSIVELPSSSPSDWSSSPLSAAGGLFNTATQFAFGNPLGTALTSAIVTTAGLAVYWRYLRRIRSAEYLTPKELAWRKHIVGRVTSIGDADGFRLYHQPGPPLLRRIFYPVPKNHKALREQTLSVRLAGADAPEMSHFGKEEQPFAQEAKAELTRLIEGRTVRCEVAHVDQYKRLVATPWVWRAPYIFGRTNVSLALVRKGLATVYRQTGAEYGSATFLSRLLFKASTGLGRLERAETWARRRRLGIWSLGKKHESPADYKRRMKEGR